MSDIGKNVCTGIQCDVLNLKDLDRAYDLTKDQKGRRDILFANAGVIQFAPLEKSTEEHFDNLFNINVKGLFTVQKALPIFSDGGYIIVTSSIGASKGAK